MFAPAFATLIFDDVAGSINDLTVDLIYGEIRQGSHTTVNDELKLWKDEQARIDALSAALPQAVANAMLSSRSGRLRLNMANTSSRNAAKSSRLKLLPP